MDFGYTPKVEALRERMKAFMDDHVVPANIPWHRQYSAGTYPLDVLEPLKAKAKAAGLWNMFMPHLPDGIEGTGLTNME